MPFAAHRILPHKKYLRILLRCTKHTHKHPHVHTKYLLTTCVRSFGCRFFCFHNFVRLIPAERITDSTITFVNNCDDYILIVIDVRGSSRKHMHHACTNIEHTIAGGSKCHSSNMKIPNTSYVRSISLFIKCAIDDTPTKLYSYRFDNSKWRTNKHSSSSKVTFIYLFHEREEAGGCCLLSGSSAA